LHVHIICRNTNDPAWPSTVWDHKARSPYDEDSKNLITNRLKFILQLL
jgi:diadenosine tetraphosphate (Ap4A) HIT family hydrolase